MIVKKEAARETEKYGVLMRIYPTREDCPAVSLCYQETNSGHAEEFYHDTSNFLYYIIEGAGVWVIEGTEYPVNAGDVVLVTCGKKFYYKGKLKQICITAPAWSIEGEHHVRDIHLPDQK